MEEREKATGEVAESTLGAIARTYEELRKAKAQRKMLKKQLKEEMTQSPSWEVLERERAELRARANELKMTCLEALGTEGDMRDADIEVKELQAVMDDLMASALSQGLVKNLEEMDIAGDKVKPCFKVKIKVEQMALGI